jgi:hypothetical protein
MYLIYTEIVPTKPIINRCVATGHHTGALSLCNRIPGCLGIDQSHQFFSYSAATVSISVDAIFSLHSPYVTEAAVDPSNHPVIIILRGCSLFTNLIIIQSFVHHLPARSVLDTCNNITRVEEMSYLLIS